MLRIMAGMTPNDSCSEECRKIGFYWEMTSYVSVFSSLWFDSGYIFLSVYGRLVVFTHSWVKVDLGS